MVAHILAWKLALACVVILTGAAIGIPLARYAEADDAPGGVVIAALIMVGAAVLAVWIVNRRPKAGAGK